MRDNRRGRDRSKGDKEIERMSVNGVRGEER